MNEKMYQDIFDKILYILQNVNENLIEYEKNERQNI